MREYVSIFSQTDIPYILLPVLNIYNNLSFYCFFTRRLFVSETRLVERLN